MRNINKGPFRKSCTHAERLVLGTVWLKEYEGKNLIRGYAKYFGVNKPCAIRELEMLGVEFTEERKKQVMNSYNGLAKRRRKKKQAREKDRIDSIDSDERFAFIVGYTSGGAAYGVTWEECEELEKYEQHRDAFQEDEMIF
jgi:hypothetical protein